MKFHALQQVKGIHQAISRDRPAFCQHRAERGILINMHLVLVDIVQRDLANGGGSICARIKARGLQRHGYVDRIFHGLCAER